MKDADAPGGSVCRPIQETSGDRENVARTALLYAALSGEAVPQEKLLVGCFKSHGSEPMAQLPLLPPTYRDIKRLARIVAFAT